MISIKRLKDWYSKPTEITLRFKKQTVAKTLRFIIEVILIVLLVKAHVHALGRGDIIKPSVKTGYSARTDKPLFGGFSVSDDLFTKAIKKRNAKIAHAKRLRIAHLKRLQALRKQRAAIKTAQATHSVRTHPTVYQAPKVVTSGCGDNQYAHFIYMHESGCSTTSVNALGCYGIGQDCNGIVRAKCSANYSCQNAYFTAYALSRYGSWLNAYNWWLGHSWW